MNYSNDILNSFNNYLIQKGITKEDSKQYVEKIEQFLQEYTLEKLIQNLMELIRHYSSGRSRLSEEDSGITQSSLIIFAEYIIELSGMNKMNLCFQKGWESFAPRDKYVSGYEINGNMITICYSKFNEIVEYKNKKIKQRDFIELCLLLYNHRELLSPSDTLVFTFHGACEFSYEILNKSGINCCSFFASANQKYASLVDYLNDELRIIIDRIIKL